MANQNKQAIADNLSNLLKTNQNFILVKFEKTSHVTLEQLRRELKKNQAQIKVLKNTIFEKVANRLSAANKSFGELRKKAFPLRDNSAVVFLNSDWAEGLKSFYQFISKEKSLTFKVGILDNQIYESATLTRIAELPAKDVLIGKVIGSMKSPSARFVHNMKSGLNKFVYILKAKSEKK